MSYPSWAKNLDNNSVNLTETSHAGRLDFPYFEYVRDGVKKYEMRVNDDKRRKMNVADTWIFTSPIHTEPIKTLITEKKIYKSFREAISDKGYKNLLPNATSLEEAIKIYNAFDNGNYERDAETMGVVCFTLKVEPN